MPPSGLEKLDTAPLHELGALNCAAAIDDHSRANWRRTNSVISNEPIHTRRTASTERSCARACSCAAVQRPAAMLDASGRSDNPVARS